MAGDPQQFSHVSDPNWLEFESLLTELGRLAKSDTSFERLIRSLLEQTVHILAAIGGAVWLGEGSKPLRLECQLNHTLLDGPGDSFHRQLLEQIRAEGEAVVVPPGGTSIGSRILPNPTDFTLLIGPLKVDQDVVGLFEVIQRSASAAAVRGNRRLLVLVCELAADHLRRQELRQLRDERLRSEQFDRFTELIHGSLDLANVAYNLANAGRQFIDCDRVSVAIRKGRRFKLKAISGVDTPNRRSNAVRRLEELAARVASTNEAIWYDGEEDHALAPQILEPLKRFADDVHPRMIGLISINATPGEIKGNRKTVVAVLIVEQFNSVLGNAERERASRVARHSAPALVNALRYQALPTLPFARLRNGPLGQPAIRIFPVLAAVAGVSLIASLAFMPMDFNVHAEGELQPQQRQHVFAPFDAQVASIRVRHGDQVAANDVLVELRSPDMDLESQRIQGEFDVTVKRLSAIESSLLQIETSNDRETGRANQLAAEQEELRQLLESQREQLSLLRQQREKLVLRSPIDGRVLTWDLEQSLADRPVQRGQLLLSVANLKGPWVTELEVPDNRIEAVLKATEQSGSVRASFQLATNRGDEHRGVIRRISTRTEATTDDRPIVRVTMDVDEDEIRDLRPGATVFAKIHCGRKSAAYVLFHDLFDAARNWLRF